MSAAMHTVMTKSSIATITVRTETMKVTTVMVQKTHGGHAHLKKSPREITEKTCDSVELRAFMTKKSIKMVMMTLLVKVLAH